MVRPLAMGEQKPQWFVRLECPYPILRIGLVRTLEEAGVRCYTDLLPIGEPYIVVIFWAEEGTKGLREAVGRAHEAHAEATTLVFALRNDLEIAQAALRAGARGFVHAEMELEQIVRALKVASSGKIAAPRELLEYLLTENAAAASSPPPTLSDRQQEVLVLVADGFTNTEIGSRLFLTESTVKQHLRAVYKGLKVKNRTQAVRAWRKVS